MEPLIRSLNELAYTPKPHISLLTSPFGYKVSNLVFADDCLIFAKATIKGARNVLEVLNKFANDLLKNDIVNILQIQHKTTIG